MGKTVQEVAAEWVRRFNNREIGNLKIFSLALAQIRLTGQNQFVLNVRHSKKLNLISFIELYSEEMVPIILDPKTQNQNLFFPHIICLWRCI